MKPPDDGDRSSIEDGLIAEIIPLRRRAPDRLQGDDAPYEPEPSDVFDPPPEPESLEEYSVWERPTAELLRREPPEPLAPTLERAYSAGRVVGAHRWLAPAVVGAVGMIAIALVAFRFAQHAQSPSTLGQTGSQAGLGPTLGRMTTPGVGERSTTHARSRRRRTSPSAPRRRAAETQSPKVGSGETSGVALRVRHTTTPSSSRSNTNTLSSDGADAHATATAAREFGFER